MRNLPITIPENSYSTDIACLSLLTSAHSLLEPLLRVRPGFDGRATAAHRLTGTTFLPFLDAIAINHLEMKTSLVHY